MFRADGSTTIGMGHVTRCLALAEGLKVRGVSTTLVTKTARDLINAVRRDPGVDVRLVAGASAEADARETALAVRDLGAAALVTDVCHAAVPRDGLARFHALLRPDLFTVAIVGAEVLDLDVDVIVSPYVRPANLGLAAARPDVLALVGPAYAVVRSELRRVVEARRHIAPRARRILVTIGGADPHRLTAVALRALILLDDPSLEVRVIIGPAFLPEAEAELRRIAEGLRGPSDLVTHEVELGPSMLWADLAVTGDGLTKYETAAAGTPSVVLVSPTADRAAAAAFADAGTAASVPTDGTSPHALENTLRRVVDDAALRASMSRRGRSLIDGRAVDRLSEVVLRGASERRDGRRRAADLR